MYKKSKLNLMKLLIRLAVLFLVYVIYSISLSCSQVLVEEQHKEKVSVQEERPERSFPSDSSSVFDSCSTNKEICNNLDDNCNGLIDDNIPPTSCTPMGTTKVCSKGLRYCYEGQPTLCSNAILPLSPSCLINEDLDCDNKPDIAIFGRKTQEKTVSPLSDDFRILAHIELNGEIYLMLIRLEEEEIFLEVWMLHEEPVSLIVIKKEKLWHSEIRNSNTLGRMFVTSNKNILLGYCTAPNFQKKCWTYIIEMKNKKMNLLSLPILPSQQVYGDFVYNHGILALLYFDGNLIEKKQEENITTTISLFALDEQDFTLKNLHIPPINLELYTDSIRYIFPLKNFYRLEAEKFLLITSTDYSLPKNMYRKELTAYIFEKEQWNKYSYSSDIIISFAGLPQTTETMITFPYKLSPVSVATLQMKWEIGKISFDLSNKLWIRKALTQVEGTLRIEGILQEDGASIFAVSWTTCDDHPNLLKIYTFNTDGTKTENYLFSTRSNPRNIVLHQKNKHFFLLWLSGNQLLCGWKNEINKLHWLEFGNCN